MNDEIVEDLQIRDGEAFAAYLLRRGYYDEKRHRGSRRKHSWVLPSRLVHHAERLGLASADRLVDENTLVPVLYRFLSRSDEAKLIGHHLGEPSLGITGMVGLTVSLGPPLRWAPGICLCCMSDDMEMYGHTFWRRDFLLPEIRWCARHNAPLYRLCDPCTIRFGTGRKFDMPFYRCLCGRPLALRPTTVHSHERELAKGWQALLDSNFAPFIGSQEIAALTNSRARELGLVTDEQVYEDRCDDYFGAQRLRALGKSIDFLFNSKPVANALLGQGCMRHPVHGIFLLVALFGNWRDVENLMISQSEYLEALDEGLVMIET
ncbi:hypothetical protein [Paraburkholderia sp. 22B1P]|uniref:hypothetical protein n=1 Tax=Paraburkholderia sp. 22B1P TaxID=3080498 RepID=UPI0030910B9B|nr:TniQ family protein [Paraburkholderia sp. 22B1P]